MKREQFEHVCKLARLELAPDETAEFAAKFERLLEFVDAVQSYPEQDDREPMVLGEYLAFRADTKREFEWPEDFEHDYRVPKIIDFDGGA